MLLSDEAIDKVREEGLLAPAKAQTLRDDLVLRATVPPVFVLTYAHPDADMAKHVLESIIDGFRAKRDAAAAATADAVNQIDDEISDYELRIQFADADLTAFKRDNADYLDDPESKAADTTAIEDEIAKLEQQAEEAVAERDRIAGELAKARSPAAAADDAEPLKTPSEIQIERAALDGELAKLQERYADSHPYVIAVLDAIDALQAEAEAVTAASKAAEADAAAEAKRDALEQQHGDLIVKVAALNSRLEEKRSEIELLETLTQTASSVEAELAQLEADREALTDALADLQQRRDEMEDVAQGEAKQEAFRLIKQPELPTDPVGPSRLMALAAVLLGGAGLGAAVALFCNRIKGVFESAWQLRRRFDVGVLGTISEVLTPAERKQLAHSRLAFGLACLTLVGAFSGLAFAELTNRLAPLGDQLRTQILG
ncbi:MAG: hypothetical protein R3F54_05835 [Alphaproteobacteria bacterium]